MKKKIIIMLAAILFLVVGGLILVKEIGAAKRCTMATTGVVESMREERHGDDRDYYATIRYEVDGRVYQFETSVSSSKQSIGPITFSKASYSEGEGVILMYNPDDPNDVMIEGEKIKWIASGLMILGGLFLIVMVLKGKVE